MKTFLNKIQEEKQMIQATCNGNQTCGRCKIRILNNKLDVTEIENKLLTKQELLNGIRLACAHEYNDTINYELINDELVILEDMCKIDLKIGNESGQGIIVDIGTTTIVMKWIDLKTGKSFQTISFKNPQATYGGDVISRIKYSEEHPHLLHEMLINEMEKYLMGNDDVKRMVICGNTVMLNLFLDSDVTSLGHMPFKIPIQSLQKITSDGLFKHLKHVFDIYTFPHIASFVGGDIVAGILALDIDLCNTTKMLIDLGTNGEIVIGNKNKIITTSSSAGPAFEGVGITCGGPSIAGAIVSVKIKSGQVTCKTIGNQEAICICGSGLVSLIAELKRNNIINEIGRFTSKIDKFYITEDIYITNKDIQTFQLAKAAIYAGVTALFQELGEVDEIYISGGFGTGINVDDLIELNIIDSKYCGRIKSVKNSAISGAYTLLRTQDYERLNKIVNISENINLATYPDFDDLLIDGLYF